MIVWNGEINIDRELIEVDKYIKEALKTRQAILRKEAKTLLNAGGKRLRPALVLLSGQFGEYDRKKLIPLAAGIEILHMATLVHDDIIDDSDTRRGTPTAQAKWGKDVAVFLGDFLFTRSFSLITQNVEMEKMHKLSNVMKAICEGEIDQYESQYGLTSSVSDYLKRIVRKTALLFALSCRIGAEECNCKPRDVWNLERFGKNLGMAFQIKDDLLDFYGDSQTVGKPLLVDFANGIFTLPIIYTVGDSKYKNKIQEIIDRGEFSQEELENARKWVYESGGVDYAEKLALRYTQKAVGNLESLPAIPAREDLENLLGILETREY